MNENSFIKADMQNVLSFETKGNMNQVDFSSANLGNN